MPEARKNKKKKLFISRFLPVVFGVFLLAILFFQGSSHSAKGSTKDNVEGWAWSSNIGWISFNCTNDSSCGSSNYGVKIYASSTDPSRNLNLGGYAWSANVGWIAFEDSSDPPDGGHEAFNSSCTKTCDNASNCIACLNPDDGKIWGWAKIVSLGNDGWIKLQPNTTDGVYIDQNSATGEFKGWGWNGNTDGSGVGWISFNCLNSGSCASSAYAVRLTTPRFPVVNIMRAPNYSFADACASTAKGGVLQWTIKDPDSGSSQSAYRVIVNTSNVMTGGVVDTGKVSSPSLQYVLNASALNYQTPYYWWVKVWDDFGFSSPWKQFDTTASGTLTDNIALNNSISPNPTLTFTTYKHEFPDVNFSWLPAEPLVDETVKYSATTSANFYRTGAPAVPAVCDEANCSWLWSPSAAKTNSTPTASTTLVTFGYGTFLMDLVITDLNDGYYCSTTLSNFIDLLPKWREIKPN